MVTAANGGEDTLTRRALVTLGAVAVYRLALLVPVPGVDAARLREFYPGTSAGEALTHAQASGMAIGIVPAEAVTSYLGAAILVLLVSALVPPLRRWREGGPLDQLLFDRLIVALTLAFALTRGWGLALFLEAVAGPRTGEPLVPVPGWGFRLTTTVSVAAGTLLVVWLAHAISRRGVGNGVAVLLVAELLAGLGVALHEEYRAVADGLLPRRCQLYGAGALVLAAAASVAANRAARRLRLVRASGAGGSGARDRASDLAIRLRLNAVGVLPIRGAQTIIPAAATGLSYLSAPLLGDAGRLDFPPTGAAAAAATITIGAVLVLVLSQVYAFITLDPRDAVRRAARMGYSVEGGASEQEAARLVRRTQRGLATANGVYLFGVALAPWALHQGLGVTPAVAAFCGTHMLVLVAVGLDVARQVRAEGAGGGGRVPVWSAQTELEVQIGQRILAEAGVPSSLRLNRVVAASGTPSFWEVARPRWPGLTIHRSLGGGSAELLVPPAERDRAREILRARGAAVAGAPP
ncbi:MAG: hypothetical protein ABIL09_00255 [Gemmatimonadota bacterium]